MVATGLSFLSVALVGFALAGTFFRERNMLSHVRYYDQELSQQRNRGAVALTAFGQNVVERVADLLERKGWRERLSPVLEAAGLSRTPAEYVVRYAAGALVVLLFVWLLTDALFVTLIAAGVAVLAPKYLLELLADRRRRQFEQQLPDALAMIATSLRGGWTFERAIELVAAEAPAPMSREFARAVSWLGLGMPMNEVLDTMSRRIASADFETFVSGVSVQREVGGNLAEVLDMITDTMREREALRRQVRTLTAEARFSAYILIALPFVIVLMMFATSRSYIIQLFTTPIGIGISVLSLVMIAVAAIWIMRLTKVEV